MTPKFLRFTIAALAFTLLSACVVPGGHYRRHDRRDDRHDHRWDRREDRRDWRDDRRDDRRDRW